MDDLEITRRCAEAMGYKLWQSQKWGYWEVTDPYGKRTVVCENWPKFNSNTGEKLREPSAYDALCAVDFYPLHDDAQAMALLKEWRMTIVSMDSGKKWHAIIPSAPFNCDAISPDLNRAICLAVAQRGKE